MGSKIDTAKELVESARYALGSDTFLSDFVDMWAFQHTNQFPPKAKLRQNSAFMDLCCKLSRVLQELMLSGEHDPISLLMTNEKSTVKGFDFYPSPASVSEIMKGLLLEPISLSRADSISLYEPTAGPAGLIFEQIKMVAYSRTNRANPLEGVVIRVEDINPIAVKAFLIQYSFLINFLTNEIGREPQPDFVQIVTCDVLSRAQGSVSYYLSSPKKFDENELFLCSSRG